MISLKNKQYKEIEIIDIIDSQNYTFDCEVEKTHHYLIEDGIVSHNTATFANNVSGGLEPVISLKYTRTVIEPSPPKDLIIPKVIEWNRQVYEGKNWEWIKEGDENVLRTVFNDIVYKIYRKQGLKREEDASDYSTLNMKNFDSSAKYVKTISDLTVKEHIDTMKIFATYIDSSISKTINFPNDYSFEDFKSVYIDAYNSGVIKGLTTFRLGTMASFITIDDNGNGNGNGKRIIREELPERPKSLQCHIYRITVKGEKWIVFVGLYKNEPFEVFAGKVNMIEIKDSIEEGTITRIKSGHYQFEYHGKVLIPNIIDIFENSEQEALTRMISTALQAGSPIDEVISQLNKSHGTIVDFNKSIIRALKKYMKEKESKEKCEYCGSSLIFVEGCVQCKNCNFSKCL